MGKRNIITFFYNKKGLELAKTLIYIIVAIGAILIFGWVIFKFANTIFG